MKYTDRVVQATAFTYFYCSDLCLLRGYLLNRKLTRRDAKLLLHNGRCHRKYLHPWQFKRN